MGYYKGNHLFSYYIYSGGDKLRSGGWCEEIDDNFSAYLHEFCSETGTNYEYIKHNELHEYIEDMLENKQKLKNVVGWAKFCNGKFDSIEQVIKPKRIPREWDFKNIKCKLKERAMLCAFRIYPNWELWNDQKHYDKWEFYLKHKSVCFHGHATTKYIEDPPNCIFSYARQVRYKI